jgi:hypothetical protein
MPATVAKKPGPAANVKPVTGVQRQRQGGEARSRVGALARAL